MKKDKYQDINSFEDLLDVEYGIIGSEKRNELEEKAQMFVVRKFKRSAQSS